MLVRRPELTGGLEALRREMDRLFEGYAPEAAATAMRPTRGFPAINAWEDGSNLFVEAEIPGVDRSALDIQVLGSELSIKGHREPLEGRNSSFHRQERGAGDFARFVTLPVEVDADKVEAVLADGVLTVKLPKAEAARARSITVKTS